MIDYKRANIQTWMLTGDKGKTAKMIGIQCGMFSSKIRERGGGADGHATSKNDDNEIVEERKKSSPNRRSSDFTKLQEISS